MASLVSYGVCQTACNAGVVACYAAAGLVFGTITGGAGMPVAAVGCNAAQGACMAACAAKLLVEGSAETAATGGVMGPIIAGGGAVLAVAVAGGMMGPGAKVATSTPWDVLRLPVIAMLCVTVIALGCCW
mmetsp:Transcript_73397/g.192453  ORF Transcript_73397/g.192453 Transcript_73397/m.192453 type:complete len:130 (-) Transcript_73397:253-642(-)